jgi:hypothetical protein
MLDAMNRRCVTKAAKKLLAGGWAPRIAAMLAMFALMTLASPLLAQRADTELVSKADAVRLFAMSRQQWEENVAAAVAARLATRAESSGFTGMTMRTDTGFLSTRLDYSNGDQKPTTIQLAIGYRPEHAWLFTDERARSVIAEVERQMAPEFEVIGDANRPMGGWMFNFFIIKKK